LKGKGSSDRINAGGGNDTLKSGGGNDTSKGCGGRDLVQGDGGNDSLLGYGGDDILVGGKGFDTLNGGGGRDMFVFKGLNEGKDKILGFSSEDIIDLRSIFAQPQFADAKSETRFLKYVQLTQVGASTEVKVDMDGIGAGKTFTTLATLSNTGIGAVGSRNFVIS